MKRLTFAMILCLLLCGEGWGATNYDAASHSDMATAVGAVVDGDNITITGSFSATSVYEIDNNIIIKGATGTETISQGYDGGILKIKLGADGSTIKNFIIDGNRTKYTTGTKAIYGDDATYSRQANNITISGMTISNYIRGAIHMLGCDGWTISNNTITNIGDGTGYTTGRSPIWADRQSIPLEDCESAVWDEYVDGNVSVTLDAAVYKVGTKSIKLAVGADAVANRVLATNNLTSRNISKMFKLWFWVYSSVALDAGDMQILLDNTANCVSPLESIDIPAIAATTWTPVIVEYANVASDTAIVSVGIKQVVDKGAFDLYVDYIQAVRGATNTTISGNTITGEAGKTGTLIRLTSPSDNSTITGNTLTGANAHGIVIYSETPNFTTDHLSKNVTISNNTITDVAKSTAADAILWSATGTISGNTITQNDSGYNAWGVEASGFYPNPTTFTGNTFGGTHLEKGIVGSLYGCTVSRNQFTVMESCVYDTGGSSIYNNLCVMLGGGTEKAGIYLYAYYIDSLSPILYNNTIVNVASTVPGVLAEEANATTMKFVNITLKNNIIYGFPQAVAVKHVESGLPLTHQYNDYYGNTKNIQFYDGSYQDHALDATELTSDPLFVNAASNWALQANSPCVDSGDDLGSTYRMSLNGDQYANHPWEIGAYSYRRGGGSASKNTGSIR